MVDPRKFGIPNVIYLLAIIWAVHAIQWLIPGNLHHFGILPRTFIGLLQIPLAPFIHGSLFHLIGNSIGLLGFGILIHLKERSLFWELCAVITVLAGLGTWLVGNSSYHIGASGLVLGLWAYVLADAFFRRSIRAIVIAAVTLLFYGGLIFSVFDFRPGISWSGHVSGIVSGMLVAWLNAKGVSMNKNKPEGNDL